MRGIPLALWIPIITRIVLQLAGTFPDLIYMSAVRLKIILQH
jgi:hypothetical protein